jgi:hypothetical protein
VTVSEFNLEILVDLHFLSLATYFHVYCGTRDEMTGSSSDDWIYYHLGYPLTVNYIQIQAIQRYH